MTVAGFLVRAATPNPPRAGMMRASHTILTARVAAGAREWVAAIHGPTPDPLHRCQRHRLPARERIEVGRIYVGNLSFDTTDETLRRMFEEHGTVTGSTIRRDAETGRSRGFAFVEMSNPTETGAAITALDGRHLDGRRLRVTETGTDRQQATVRPDRKH
ncbi:RNA recognition motif domain-containing protein [Embleya sp. MST-111070]|uniref:RNA recognition motif domain-containing protein n=1 Tax=Embleya sp. MST-111070 TaxID=3398231 RepID=UPI003F73DEF3